jgi:hypothetical protein
MLLSKRATGIRTARVSTFDIGSSCERYFEDNDDPVD